MSPPILEALSAVGYESPSPIQARTIPAIIAGSDVLGQAQTGTGKTAAFALPVLSRLDLKLLRPQALVLVPTRELAIQVSEAFQKYAAGLPGFHVLPIYGGQSYTPQLKALKRGVHVIVGTPGRVMDHMKSGAMSLADLRFLVLDEGDEMLQMGFVDDIEWILEQTPPERQIALFSATMPAAIRRIAQKHMRSPLEITIQNRAGTMPKIRQRYWLVSGMHKLDALTRVLEVTRFDAMLIFVRTKLETVELADRLEARGFGAAPLNGDIQQQQRERTVAALKAGKLDILVATDVAARGLDVERISHVVNYDIPYDSETYVHRIGRTGRAGRSGEAILFVAPRERNMLRIIERVTKQQLEPMTLPSVADVNEHRVLKFKERVAAAVQSGQGKVFEDLLRQIEREQNVPAIEIAASLAGLLQGSAPFLLPQRAGQPEPRGATGVWGQDASSEPSRDRSSDDRSARGADRKSARQPGHERGQKRAREPAREHRKGAWQEPASESVQALARESAQESAPESAQDFARESTQALARESVQEPTPESTRDFRRQSAQEFAPEPAQEFAPESAQHFGRESAQESTQDLEREPPQGPARESTRRPPRESAGNPAPRHSRDQRPPMDSYRIEVGHVHGVQPGNIVGAIANEAGLDGRYIGHIDIRNDHTFIDLPKGMPAEIFRELQKVRVRGEEMRISRVGSKTASSERTPPQHKPRGPREATRTNTPKAPRPSKLKRKLRRAAAKG